MNSHGADNLAGIVLAAGRSRRFEGDKRLAPYDANHTLLTKSISLVEPYLKHLVIATRLDDAERSEALLGQWLSHPRVEQFLAPSADKGMGHTLAEAVGHLKVVERRQGRQFSGVLVMLADMPRLRSTTVSCIVAAATADGIVRPCYKNENDPECKEPCPGHPVLFGRLWFDELQHLSGDRGAKSIVEGNSWARTDIQVDDPGILLDVDRPDDLSQSRQSR